MRDHAEYVAKLKAERAARKRAKEKAREQCPKRKEQQRLAARHRRASHPEKYREREREYRRNNLSRERNTYLKYAYGITLQQRDELLAKQGGCCAICKTAAPGTCDWHTDHCHLTNKIRGILCSHCNRMLGYARDNFTILRTAATYLEANNGKET